MIHRLLETVRSTLRRPYLLRIIKNTGWLFADKIVRGGVGLFVAIWMARYLGPDQFGTWNFVLAFTAIFASFLTLGLDSVVVRDIVKWPEKCDAILGTAFALKLIASCAGLPIIVLVTRMIRPDEYVTTLLVFFVAAGFIFQSFNAVDLFFQSQIQSKYSVYAMDLSFLVISLAKVALILFHAPLLAFGIAGFVESLLTATLLLWVYRYNRGVISSWRFSRSIAKSMLKDSWPLMLAGISVMIYMRIDQIMIGQMLGNVELGVFSAAVRLSEAWYFVPMAIATSVFPSIIETKKRNELLYKARVQKLLDLMMMMGLGVAVIVSISGHFIVTLLFGEAYERAGLILAIHCWAGIFVCVGVASSTWLTAENLQKYSFYRTIIGCGLNVLLNLWVIPVWGTVGAALVTVLSYGFSSYSILFFKEGKAIGKMMLLALLPLRKPSFGAGHSC